MSHGLKTNEVKSGYKVIRRNPMRDQYFNDMLIKKKKACKYTQYL